MREASEPAEPVGSHRSRKASGKVQQNERNRLEQMEMENERLRKQLARKKEKDRRQAQADEEDDSDASGPESQDEGDFGRGRRLGGGFTSAVESRGEVSTSKSTQKIPKRLDLYQLSRSSGVLTPSRNISSNSQHTPRTNERRNPLIPPQRFQSHTQPPVDEDDESENVDPLNDDEDDTHNHQSNHKNRLADDLFNWDNDPPEPSSPTRGRTLTRSPTRSASGSQPLREKHRRQRSSPSTAPPPKRSRVQDELKEIPFAKNVKLGPKPNQKDYEEAFHPMLNAMCHSYAARIVAENAFPSDEERQVWVREIWDTECKKHGEPYELTPRLRRMITNRGSWVRQRLKDAAKIHFPAHFRFSKSKSSRAVAANKALAIALQVDFCFHHKDWKNAEGFAQSSLITDILEDAFFEDDDDMGVRHKHLFNPVPFATYAIVFSVVESLILQWNTGKFVDSRFTKEANLLRYTTHLKSIDTWSNLNPTVTKNIRAKLFRRLMERAGASETEQVMEMSSEAKERIAKQFEGHTGETDSENES